MSIFRNHYSDLTYHDIIGFTINWIYRSPNPAVKISWNGKGESQCRAFATFCLQKILYLCANFFWKGGGIQVTKQHEDCCCFYRIFSSDIEHRVSLSSAFMSIHWHHKSGSQWQDKLWHYVFTSTSKKKKLMQKFPDNIILLNSYITMEKWIEQESIDCHYCENNE